MLSASSHSSPAISPRATAIKPFYVMDLLARARQREADGADIIHMEVGEPDFTTPAPIVEAAQRALVTQRQGYTPALGLPELREALADYLSEHREKIAADNIAVTSGASAALQLALMAILAVGDEVLLPDPGYPCNAVMAVSCGATPVTLPTGAEQNYQPTAESVRDAWGHKTRAVVVASPANPTGTTIDREELSAICAVAAERGGWVVFDEIYGRLVSGDAGPTPFAEAHNLICINSFSKYHGMTGWRLGWLLAPGVMMSAIEKLAQNLMLAPSTLAQQAALHAAFLPETLAICEQRRQQFNERRSMVVDAVVAQGFTVPANPVGAFYVWARLPPNVGDSFDLSQRLLDAANVVVTPGCDFANRHADRFIRIAATGERDELIEGIRRIGRAL